MLRAQDWNIDALAFRPVAVDPGSFDDHTVDGQSFVGVYASGPFAPIAPLQLDLYVLRSHRDGARFEQGAAAERRLSFGLRTFGRAGPWDHDHEITWQTGRSGSAGIAAWSVAGEAGHSWVEADWKPRASLRLTVGSGDRDAGDPRLQTFYSLFPRGGAVDEGFSVSAANMTQGRAALTVKPRAAVEITLALNTQWRTSRRDGVYGPGGGLIRRAAGSDARHIGDSIDLIALWVVHRDVAFDLTAGWFRSGRYVAESGPSRNMTFVTPSLRIRFP